jgi:hypothetical protein
MIDINTNPSPRDLKLFALILIAFAGLLGTLAAWHPQSLLGAATILSIAVMVSLVFNNTLPRRQQLLGFLLPVLFSVVGGSALSGAGPMNVTVVVWTVGVVLCAVLWTLPRLARSVYIGWMTAVSPIGWTITGFLLGLVFYLVLTPLGLIMRLFGHDPMQRRIDESVQSYWVRRSENRSYRRYFQQF